MRNNIILLVLIELFCSVLLPGCGQEESDSNAKTNYLDRIDTRYYLEMESFHYVGVLLYLNDQPVYLTNKGISGRIPVFNFVIDGNNKARITAKVIPSDTAASFSLGISVGLSKLLIIDKEKEVYDKAMIDRLYEPKADPNSTYQKEFYFDAEMPVRWTWQGAQEISEFEEVDRKDILKLINDIADLHRQKDYEKIDALRIHFHPEGYTLGPDVHQFIKKAFKDVTSHSKYNVTVAPPEKIKFYRGTKIILVCPDGPDRVISAGYTEARSKGGEIFRHVLDPFLYFIKLEGQWRWLSY